MSEVENVQNIENVENTENVDMEIKKKVEFNENVEENVIENEVEEKRSLNKELLNGFKKLIDVSVSRGVFKPNEIGNVGKAYNEFSEERTIAAISSVQQNMAKDQLRKHSHYKKNHETKTMVYHRRSPF